MQRAVRGAFVAAAVAGFLVPAARAEVAGCGTGSWIGGTVEICDGTLVYRDYVYDDYGAETFAVGASSTGTLSNPTGDIRYPDGGRINNYADLVSLRLWLDGGLVRYAAELNSLFGEGSTIVAIAIDTDDDATTGGGPWNVVDVASSGWDVVVSSADDPTLHVDTVANTMTGSFTKPGGATWRVRAVTALADGTVMNVAFRGTQETGTWWEDLQAEALRVGDVSAFGHTVDVAKLETGVTEPAVLGPGIYERVYESAYTIEEGEGVAYDGVEGQNENGMFGQSFHFLGKYQPYGIYVPAGPEPHGIQLVLHGYSANHSSLVQQPGLQENVGDARNRILLVPLGRGPEGYYSSWSERDVLDVLADVEDNYATDPTRVFSGGYSMGGYGTYRFAVTYPDRFAGFISWVGFSGDALNGSPMGEGFPTGAVGNAFDLFQNLRHVPGAMLYAAADELVNLPQGLAILARFQELGSPFIFYEHLASDHFVLAVADDWRKESEWTKDLVLVENPAHVVYRYGTVFDAPDLGIVHDSAYWLSGIDPRDDSAYADLDLTAAGCGGEDAVTAEGYSTGIDPVPWVGVDAHVVGSNEIPADNRLSGDLRNVAEVTVDLEESCLSSTGLFFWIRTDGPTTIRLSDGKAIALPGAGTYLGLVL